jgi:hypothetical protein
MADVGEFPVSRIGALRSDGAHGQEVYPPQLVKLISIGGATIVLMCQHLQHLTLLYTTVWIMSKICSSSSSFKPLARDCYQDFDQFYALSQPKVARQQIRSHPFRTLFDKKRIIRMVSCRLKGPAEE